MGLANLLFAILSSAAIIIIFKVSERYSRDTLVLISYNYLAAFLLSWMANRGNHSGINLDNKMIIPAIITGVLFIAVFFIISLSSKYAGVAKTTLASKMSFVIPVVFSVVYWGELLTSVKLLGFLLAFISVFLVVYRSGKKKVNVRGIIYPALLFIGAGLVDSTVKYIQQTFLRSGGEQLFTLLVFGVAFLLSVSIIFFQGGIKRLFSFNRILLGAGLGTANYFSLYFLIKSLNSSYFDSSIVFSIINTGIVLFNIIVGIYIFRERISLLNKVGVFLAIIALLALTIL